MTEYDIELRLIDLCDELQLSEEACVELVSCGIVKPPGSAPDDWVFDLTMVSVAKRAIRLRQELELDWSAVALVLNLLDERDQLRLENQTLQQRLERFLLDEV
jgi:chaperone modulatory protein CbpM